MIISKMTRMAFEEHLCLCIFFILILFFSNLDRLETANRKLANQDEEGQEDSHDYLSESELTLTNT